MKPPWHARERRLAARSTVAGLPRSAYWAEDWTIEPAKVWLPGRILLWCAGVDRSLLRTRAEALRYSGLGALVLAVACLGATTFTIFATVVIGHFRWPLAAFGVGWGIVILLIDRAIVTEPHYRLNEARTGLLARRPRERRDPPEGEGEGEGELTLSLLNPAGERSAVKEANGTAAANGHGFAPDRPAADPRRAVPDLNDMYLPRDRAGWHVRGLVYLMRLVITACIAYLVAEAAMLLIFHPEVTQELTKMHVAEFQTERTQVIDQAVNQEEGQLATLRLDWTNAVQTVAQANKQVQADNKVAAEEQQGVLYDHTPGAGQQWAKDVALENNDAKILDQDITAADKAQAAYQSLDNELAEARAADPTALAKLHVPSLTAIQASIFDDNGLNAQEQAFDAFVAQNKGDLLATAGPWVLRVLLIAIDLVPLGTKLLNRYTLYGRRMSERALIIRYHDMVRDTAILRDIDRQADIHSVHSQHHFDVEAERAEFHRWWRMGHLRPGEADSTWRT